MQLLVGHAGDLLGCVLAGDEIGQVLHGQGPGVLGLLLGKWQRQGGLAELRKGPALLVDVLYLNQDVGRDRLRAMTAEAAARSRAS